MASTDPTSPTSPAQTGVVVLLAFTQIPAPTIAEKGVRRARKDQGRLRLDLSRARALGRTNQRLWLGF